MSNERDKKFFFTLCKISNINPKDVIKFVWGKAINDEYWYGNESKTVRGTNIWNARCEVILRNIFY